MISTHSKSKAVKPKHIVKGTTDKVDIKSLTLAELETWFSSEFGADEATALRVFKHLWQKGPGTFDEMENVKGSLRKRLTKPRDYIPRAETGTLPKDGTTNTYGRFAMGTR